MVTARNSRIGYWIHHRHTLDSRRSGEIEESLAATGFTTLEVRDAPVRPEREYVFIAARAL